MVSDLAEVLARVEARLGAVEMTATEASREAGLSEDAIRNLRRAVREGGDRKGVSTRTVTALAHVLQTTTAFLLTGREEETASLSRVPLGGRIVGGGVIDVSTAQDEPGIEFEVELTVTIPDATVAYQVVGESMMPIFEPDTVVICRAHTTEIDKHLGRRVAVGTIDHGRMLKTLHAGSVKGRYDLESLNATTIRNVEIVWVARIAAIIPADEWRLLEKQARDKNLLKKPSKRGA